MRTMTRMFVPALLLSLTTGASMGAQRAPQGDAAKLIGEWRLVEMEQDGGDDPARGARPIGIIYYSATGHMAAQIMPDRKRASWPNTTQPTATQALDAVIGYAAYFGTYTVDERAKVVTHRREGALNFDVVDFVRSYAFEGNDRLVLFPKERANRRLVWERVK